MGNGLNAYVHVPDESGLPHVFGPNDELPDWAVEKIGVHAFENGQKPALKAKPSKKDA